MESMAEDVSQGVMQTLHVLIKAAMEGFVKACAGNRDNLRMVFDAISSRNPGFCCDRIVIEDGNVDDECIDFCIKQALERRHLDCLAIMLMLRAIDDEDLRDQVINNTSQEEAT
jgi:hypothetical protein